jgi:hypothetical protein
MYQNKGIVFPLKLRYDFATLPARQYFVCIGTFERTQPTIIST